MDRYRDAPDLLEDAIVWIVVADDGVRRSVEALLKSASAEVQSHANETALLAALRGEPLPRPNIIVVDHYLLMSRKGELLSAIQAVDEAMPIILLNGDDDPLDLSRMSLRTVRVVVLRKPYSPDAFLITIERMIGQSRLRSDA